jgi:hypothetical protein
MAIIPSTQKFHTVSTEVDTQNKGSQLANSRREAFTMQDILDTVPSSAGLFEEGSGGAESTQRVGSNNDASGGYSTISGGHNGIASGVNSVVGGGFMNTASGYYATVSGGRANYSSGSRSSVGGGAYSAASGNYSVVGGGIFSVASGYGSVVMGGSSNTASGGYSVIGTGFYNNATASYSSILGGSNNSTSTFANSHILGSYITSDRADTTFVQNLSIKSIPTSAAGLPSGSVWSNGGILNIV